MPPANIVNRRVGQEAGPDGDPVGRDPLKMLRTDLEALGHRQMSPLAALRLHCLDCCGGSPHEVRCCTAVLCPSWPFRMGKSPWREVSAGRREQGRRLAAQRAERAAAAKSDLGSDAGSDAPAISSADAAAVADRKSHAGPMRRRNAPATVG